MLSRSRSGGSFTTLRTLWDGPEAIQGGCVVQRVHRIPHAVRTKQAILALECEKFESTQDYSVPYVPANRPKTARKGGPARDSRRGKFGRAVEPYDPIFPLQEFQICYNRSL
jgi:hypothetical protein